MLDFDNIDLNIEYQGESDYNNYMTFCFDQQLGKSASKPLILGKDAS